jgi:regulator of protease activity HflC (stomatin/prohibitin superfamily)
MLMFRAVFENEAGLRFSRGRLVRVVGPGVYFVFGRGSKIVKIDTRPRTSHVSGQEVMTKDGGTVKLALVLGYRVVDARRFFESQAQEDEEPIFAGHPAYGQGTKLEVTAKVSLREWAMERTLKEAVEQAGELGATLVPKLEAVAAEVGVALLQCELTGLTISGNLRAAYGDLLKAELEGQAALQRARNEAATMRSLLNTARLTRENPGLLELRVLTSGARPRVSFVVGNAPTPGPDQA